MSTATGLGTGRVFQCGRFAGLADGRRDGNTDGLEYLAPVAKTLTPDAELFPAVLNGDLLQRFDIPFYVGPLDAAVMRNVLTIGELMPKVVTGVWSGKSREWRPPQGR